MAFLPASPAQPAYVSTANESSPIRATSSPSGSECSSREADDRWGSLGAGDELRRIPTVPGAYQRFYEGVMLALREDASPPVDPGGVVVGLEVLDAARKSARERRVVELR